MTGFLDPYLTLHTFMEIVIKAADNKPQEATDLAGVLEREHL